MVLEENVRIDHEKIAAFCRRDHIRKLSIFGSALTDRFGPDSDIDVLVEFEPGKTPGFAYFDIQDQLAEMFGRQVDLGTYMGLSKYIRDKVVADMVTIYGGD